MPKRERIPPAKARVLTNQILGVSSLGLRDILSALLGASTE
jgi:hypothetical protein